MPEVITSSISPTSEACDWRQALEEHHNIRQLLLMFQDPVLFENLSLTNTKKETIQLVGKLVCISSIDIKNVLDNLSNDKSKNRHMQQSNRGTAGSTWS